MDYEAECGCEYIEWGDRGAIRFCHLHAAAPSLLSAAKFMLETGAMPHGPREWKAFNQLNAVVMKLEYPPQVTDGERAVEERCS